MRLFSETGGERSTVVPLKCGNVPVEMDEKTGTMGRWRLISAVETSYYMLTQSYRSLTHRSLRTLKYIGPQASVCDGRNET